MTADTTWKRDGLCAQTDPELFFPEKGGSVDAARSVCRACPVRTECLDHALDNPDLDGVWGGTSPRQRKRIRGQNPRPAQPRPINHGTPGGYRAHVRRGEKACQSCLQAERLHSAEKKEAAA